MPTTVPEDTDETRSFAPGFTVARPPPCSVPVTNFIEPNLLDLGNGDVLDFSEMFSEAV